MKLLKKTLVCLVVFFILLICVGFLIPSQVEIQRSIVINAMPEQIQPWLDNMKTWEDWSPWGKEADPSIVRDYFGPANKPATTLEWQSDKLGSGTIIITGTNPKTGITYITSFTDTDMNSEGSISYEPLPDGTRMLWTDKMDIGTNPFKRYLGLLTHIFLGRDFNKGLAKLKQVVENRKVETKP